MSELTFSNTVCKILYWSSKTVKIILSWPHYLVEKNTISWMKMVYFPMYDIFISKVSPKQNKKV